MFVICIVANGPFSAEMKRIPYLTLKIQGQSHDENRPKSNQVIYRSGPSILPKWQKSDKLFQSYRRQYRTNRLKKP